MQEAEWRNLDKENQASPAEQYLGKLINGRSGLQGPCLISSLITLSVDIITYQFTSSSPDILRAEILRCPEAWLDFREYLFCPYLDIAQANLWGVFIDLDS